MLGILLIVFFLCLLIYGMWNYVLDPYFKKGINAKPAACSTYIIMAAATAFLLRVTLAALFRGHSTDMSCFESWADSVFKGGITHFYTSDGFHDYPPGYMYVLYIVGAIKNIFHTSGALLYTIIKMPAIICDIITGVIIYKIAKKRFSDGISTLIALLVFLNPAAIVNCALWGQVDSVYTLLILLMIYCISEKKMYASYFIFAACILVKPQALIVTPVLILGIVENVFLEDFSWSKFWKNLGVGAAAIGALFLAAVPFGIANVFDQYVKTIDSYPHPTVNAMNMWGALGRNWADLKGIHGLVWGIFLIGILLFTAYIFLKSKNKSKYYFTGAVLVFFTFMFSTRMHERYAFPAMILLVAAFALTANKHNFVMAVAVMLSQFINTVWVLYVYEKDPNLYFRSPQFILMSIVNLALVVYMVWASWKLYANNGLEAVCKVGKHAEEKNKGNKPKRSAALQNKVAKSTVFSKVRRFDIIAIAVITLVYSGIALYDLGDMHAPDTEYILSDGSVKVDLGEDCKVGTIRFFLGQRHLGETRSVIVRAQNENGANSYSSEIKTGSVFAWNEQEADATMRYVTFTARGADLSIKEIVILDKDGNPIEPVLVTPDSAKTLFDEQDENPARISFRNGTYFDEIYHARTAYEFINELPVYETTHPPLGKIFIAAGVKLFGMNPFGWRIAGTVFGILMIPIIYLFALRLLKKSWLAVVTCLLLTFDFMHFAQTRIATIDVYITFFVILMYYFMYKYYNTSFYDTPLRKGFVYLALCGTCMGLGVASKWTGVYAGIGLGVLFVIVMGKRFMEYRFAKTDPKGSTNGISHREIIESFAPNFWKTIGWCCIFFIAVPIAIYLISYIPFLKANGAHGLKAIWENQQYMFDYHSGLDATHPYSSNWIEWIIMKKPIWYYSGTISDTVKEGISSFGNPLVWWVGIPSVFHMLYLAAAKRDKNALFLLVGYFAQLVWWMFVTRITFIYHYFPCVPFIVLMVGYSIMTIYNNAKNKKAVFIGALVYAAFVVGMFAMFYPVLAGQPCGIEFAREYLKWFSWVLL